MANITPTAEPFFFPGDPMRPGEPVGCLLVHGFTGMPKEMRWMGEALNKQGFSVLGICLAGHATHPEDMIRSTYQDWLASVEDGFHLLSGAASHIYLMGLSMGGVLALTSAASLPVRGVVAMSTPYKLPDDWRLNYIDLLARIQRYLPPPTEPPGSDWFDSAAWKEHVSYQQKPMRAVGQLNQLLNEMRSTLPHVQVPVLLIHSHDDKTVWPGSMPAIYDALGSPDKDMLWIDKSGHVITRDAQRESVFQAAIEFVKRVEAK